MYTALGLMLAARSTSVAAFGGLLSGDGQEGVFYSCQAFHSLQLVLQQRLPRYEWEHTLK